MKQHTKFLWMYIGILFSFALILIIFAGLSRNSDIEQKEGLQVNIAKLSEEKLDLTNKVNSMQVTIDSLNQQIAQLTAQNDAFQSNENALIQAKEEAKNGNWSVCNEILDKIDKNTLTESQLVMYETLR